MKQKIKTKDICITGIGIALFVVLSICLRVPIFENYYACLGYVVMTVYLYSVGTLSGTLVGCIGTVLYCVLISGLRGMPGWVVGNLIIGLMLGPLMEKLDKSKNSGHSIFNMIILSVATMASTFLGILIIKSIIECILYSQPILVRMTTNMTAFVADLITIILSIPLCMMLHKHVRKLIKN